MKYDARRKKQDFHDRIKKFKALSGQEHDSGSETEQ